ncbi:DUF4192 domain-containing protein [Knoellia remsis]|nr:DUF4192 domain-containing protein [Knoellia remsis]
MTHSLKISTTDELLAVLPYQLGYRLDDCVVLAMMTGGVMAPIARVDIPPERHVREAADGILESIDRIGPDAILLVGYEGEAGASRSLMTRLHEGILRRHIGVVDHVVVRDGCWWGWCCRPTDELVGLRPEHAAGHALPDDAAVPAVAELIARGAAPLESRTALSSLVAEDRCASTPVGDELATLWQEVDAVLDPEGVFDETAPEDPAVATVLENARRWMEEVDRVPELWSRVLEPQGDRGDACEVSDSELARMLLSLRNKEWRDALIAWMSPVMFPLDIIDDRSTSLLADAVPSGPVLTAAWSEAVQGRLLGLARRVPDEWGGEAAAICTVTAAVAWGLGNGSVAGDAVIRALRADGTYRLARYLDQMIAHQLRPERSWADLAA